MTDLSVKKIATASTLSLGFKIIGAALIYATGIVLARLYGPELMGTFLIAFNLIVIVGLISLLGLDYGMLRFSALLTEKGQHVLLARLAEKSSLFILGISSLIAAGIYWLRPWLANCFNSADLPAMIPFFILALPFFSITALLRETLRGIGSVAWATFIQVVVQPGIVLALLLILYFGGVSGVEKPRALGFAFFVSIMLTLIILLFKIKVWAPNWWQRSKENLPLGDLLHYSYPLFLSTMISLVWGIADNLILAIFRSPQEVAYYGISYKIATIVSWPLFATNAVIPTFFVQLYYRQEIDRLENLACMAARWTFFLALPMCFICIMFSSELLSIFGRAFVNARWALVMLAIGQLIGVAVGTPFYLLYMTGHQKAGLKVQLIGIVISLPMMFYLSFKFGINGIALSSSLSWALTHVLGVLAVWRLLAIKTYVRQVSIIIITNFVCFFLSYSVYLTKGPLYGGVTFVIIYAIIFLNLVWRHKERLLLAPP